MSQRREFESMQYFLNHHIDSVTNQLNIRIDDTNERIDGVHKDVIDGNVILQGLLKQQTDVCAKTRQDFGGRLRHMEYWKNKTIGIAIGVGALIGLLFGIKI